MVLKWIFWPAVTHRTVWQLTALISVPSCASPQLDCTLLFIHKNRDHGFQPTPPLPRRPALNTCRLKISNTRKRGSCCTHSPELDEILGDSRADDQAVEGGVGQEQDKELVVWEANAVVDPAPKHVKQREAEGEAWFSPTCKDAQNIPGAVMVHFQHAPGRMRKI